MEYNFIHFKDILKKDLELYQERNPHLSTNSYAKKIGLSPSHILRILRGEKGLSPNKARSIVEKMSLSPRDKDLFVTIVDYYANKADDDRKKSLKSIRDQDQGRIRFRGEWYTTAISALLAYPPFHATIENIASALNITLEQAQNGCDILLAEGLAQKEDDYYFPLEQNYRYEEKEPTPNEFIQNYHKAYLKMAIDALSSQEVTEREFNSNTFLISQNNIPLIKNKINEMYMGLRNYVRSLDLLGAEKNFVFQIGIQGFKVSEDIERSKSLSEN